MNNASSNSSSFSDIFKIKLVALADSFMAYEPKIMNSPIKG